MTAVGPDVFGVRVGQEVTMHVPDRGAVTVRLTDCTVFDASSGSFALTFHAGPDAPGQGTYVLETDGLAPTPVFLVPSRPLPDGGLEYHAVFNRRPSIEPGERP